jgi:hypothetical protein
VSKVIANGTIIPVKVARAYTTLYLKVPAILVFLALLHLVVVVPGVLVAVVPMLLLVLLLELVPKLALVHPLVVLQNPNLVLVPEAPPALLVARQLLVLSLPPA